MCDLKFTTISHQTEHREEDFYYNLQTSPHRIKHTGKSATCLFSHCTDSGSLSGFKERSAFSSFATADSELQEQLEVHWIHKHLYYCDGSNKKIIIVYWLYIYCRYQNQSL